jgi:hypothetical protein
MTLESFCFSLLLILFLDKLGINVLEVLNFTFESRNFIISQFIGNSTVVLNVCQLLSSEEFLIIHLCQRVLSLHVFVVKLLKILNFSIQLLQVCLGLIQLMGFLTDANMNC